MLTTSAGPSARAAELEDPASPDAVQAETPPEVGERVAVAPKADDAAIASRLTRILEATGWFRQVQVRVEEGIVFLNGATADDSHRDWAGRLARNTEDVLAVVNRIDVAERAMWDLSPTWDKLRALLAQAVRALPLAVVGLVMLVATWAVALASVRGARGVLGRRIGSTLLADVLSRATALPVFALGLYVVLRISGLTGLALSVIGGTGLLGLIIGFAFRDIAENFLASLLISMQRPFATGDLICVAGHTGFVQRVNTRATLLMTLQGNHVQVPNAMIYKEVITNFTANPNERFDFIVGIGYEDPITRAQTVALGVLQQHSAVLADPEPLVLAERLGPATVDLRVYFWVNISTHSGLKVRSSVMRQTKRAFDEAGISMPDEAREVVFPQGVPIRSLPGEEAPGTPTPAPAADDASLTHSAEGELASEAGDIEQQARRSRTPEGGQNLLER